MSNSVTRANRESCPSKVPYSRATAERIAMQLNEKGHGSKGHPLVAYECKACGKHHVGHKRVRRYGGY